MATGDKSPAYKAWTARMSYALDSGFRREIKNYEKKVEAFKRGFKYEHGFFSVGCLHWFIYSVKCALHGAEPYTIQQDYSDHDNGANDYAFYQYDCLRFSKGLGWKLEGLYCVLSLLFSLVLFYTRIQQELRSALRGGTGFGFLTFRYVNTYGMEAGVAKTLARLDGTLKVLMIALLAVSFVSILFGRRILAYLVNIVVPILLFMDAKEVYRQFADQFSFVATARKMVLFVAVVGFLVWFIYSILTMNLMAFIILIVGAVLLSNLKFFGYIGLIAYYFLNKGKTGIYFVLRKKPESSNTTGRTASTERTRGSVAKTVAYAAGASLYGDVSDSGIYESNGSKINKLEAEIKELERRIFECEINKRKEIEGRGNFGAREDAIKSRVQSLENDIKIYKRQIDEKQKKIKDLKKSN